MRKIAIKFYSLWQLCLKLFEAVSSYENLIIEFGLNNAILKGISYVNKKALFYNQLVIGGFNELSVKLLNMKCSSFFDPLFC